MLTRRFIGVLDVSILHELPLVEYSTMGMQRLNGRALDSRPRGRGFEPHRRHCVVSLSKNINPSLVLFQHRKTRPYITERLLMGRKKSNQTNKIFYKLTLLFLSSHHILYKLDRIDGTIRILLSLCILGIFPCFCSRLLTIFKIDLLKNSFSNAIRVSNGLDPVQDRRFVGPDLDPNYLQVLSADDKRHH